MVHTVIRNSESSAIHDDAMQLTVPADGREYARHVHPILRTGKHEPSFIGAALKISHVF